MTEKIPAQPSRRIAEQLRSRPVLASYMLIVLVSVLALAPALMSGMPYGSHDALTHAKWQHFFSGQLWSGDLYPRWLAGMNDGYGSPAFFVYPPFPHFIAALGYLFLPDLAAIGERLAWSALAAFIAGGIGMFHWLRHIAPSDKAAGFGAVVYLLAPYHLYVDTYFRGALAELWAFSWAPWTLLAIHLFRSQPRRASVIFTLSIAGLLLSHAPSSLFLLPMYGMYALHHARTGSGMRTVAMTLTGMVVGAALAGAYLGTALTHTQYINTAEFFTGYFDSSRWLLLDSGLWPDLRTRRVVSGVALVQVAVATAFGITALVLARAKPSRRAVVFALVGSVITTFLMCKASAPVWEIVTPLRKMQFPWRLLLLQTIFLAALSSLLIYEIESAGVARGRVALFAVCAVTLLGFAGVNATLLALERNGGPKVMTTEHLRADDTAEYVLGNTTQLQELFPGKAQVVVLRGAGRVDIKQWRPRLVELQVDAQSPVHIAVRQFNYTGWQYRILDAQRGESSGTVSRDYKIVNVRVPPGRHVIELRLAPTAGEKFGWLISALGMLGLAGWLLAQTRQRTRRGRPACQPVGLQT